MTDATWLDKQMGVHEPSWSKTMRLLLTTIILTMLAQPALALTNLQLFEYCKPYANNGYSIDGLYNDQIHKSTAFTLFQSGALHHAHWVCKFASNKADKEMFGSSIMKPKISIQKFLNWAEENTEWWGEPVAPVVWLQNTCKD